MRPNRLILASVVLLAGLAWWGWRAATLRELGASLRGIEAEAIRLQERTGELEAVISRRQREAKESAGRRGLAVAKAADLVREAADRDSVRTWNAPPAELPQWDAESPFVWIEKALLPDFPVPVFGEDGALRDDVAAVLTLEPERARELNAKLRRVLADYRERESAAAHLVPENATASEGTTIEQMTLRVEAPRQEGERACLRFAEVLTEALGPQRGDLVLGISEGWIDQHLNADVAQPRTITVVREADGRFRIDTSWDGGGRGSVGGVTSLAAYVPEHLMRWFEPLVRAESANGSAGEPAR